jgi:hypothetical protein
MRMWPGWDFSRGTAPKKPGKSKRFWLIAGMNGRRQMPPESKIEIPIYLALLFCKKCNSVPTPCNSVEKRIIVNLQ